MEITSCGGNRRVKLRRSTSGSVTGCGIVSGALIRPLTENAHWLAALLEMPRRHPPKQHTLVVAPHPDDETLGCGALIATLRMEGVRVTVVAATDGENCYDTSVAERAEMRRIREREQNTATETLGVSAKNVHRLRLQDSGLHLLERELADGIRQHARPGTHLLAPWSGDFHPDHEACARAAMSVAKEKGLPLSFYFFWTWHRGTPALLSGLPVTRFVPDDAALQQKLAALRCHRSQLERAGGEAILPEYLLGPAHWPFEVFLPA